MRQEPFYSLCAESSSCPEGDSAHGDMGVVFLSPVLLPVLEVEAEDRPPQNLPVQEEHSQPAKFAPLQGESSGSHLHF